MNKLFLNITIMAVLAGPGRINIFPEKEILTGFLNNEILITPQSKKSKRTLKKPLSVKQAQRIQEKKEKEQKRTSKDFIEENRKRSLEIQTPEVRERMKQNVKNANSNYDSRKKANSSRAKKAKRKYK